VEISLTPRQEKILKAIIEEFVSSIEPVSSRVILHKLEIDCSSATIRNEMAELESKGYLFQVHTSSGRIPTHKGYRYYIDYLMEKSSLSPFEAQFIKQKYEQNFTELEEIISITIDLLAKLSNSLSIITSPQIKENWIKDIYLSLISSNRLLLVIIISTGVVIKKVIDNPPGLILDKLEEVSNILREKFCFRSLFQINNEITEERGIIENLLLEKFINCIKDSLIEYSGELLAKGVHNLLNLPEFKNTEKIKKILELIEANKLREIFYNISLAENIKELKKVNIIIGEESSFAELKECAIITTNYTISGDTIGLIGILGPTRMHYWRLVPLVDFIAKNLSLKLEELTLR